MSPGKGTPPALARPQARLTETEIFFGEVIAG